MTQDEIIELAMAYGFTGGFDASGNLTYDATFVEAVAEAVAAEREACANLCEDIGSKDDTFYREESGSGYCADAIRARGEA